MSFFAKVNDDNIVEQVVIVEDGCDADWCNNFFGFKPQRMVQSEKTMQELGIFMTA